MIQTRADLDAFVAGLPGLIREHRIWPAAPGSGESGHDQIAFAIRDWLPQEAKPLLHAEGLLKHDPPIRPVPRTYRGGFCGSWNSPDIALILPEVAAISIEVDRARGKGGASVRTAMTKGCFGVLTGEFHECHVYVFRERGCPLDISNPESERIFARFREDFRTHVHVFEHRS